MNHLRSVLIVLLAVGSLRAVEIIPVPGESWAIHYSGSSPTQLQGSVGENGYQYKSMSEAGVMVSLFVEKPQKPGASNADVETFYWGQASQNPMIDARSIKRTKAKDYCRVEYQMEADLQDGKHAFTNVNYYFQRDGKWIDLHVSFVADPAQQVALCKAFDASLAIKPVAP